MANKLRIQPPREAKTNPKAVTVTDDATKKAGKPPRASKSKNPKTKRYKSGNLPRSSKILKTSTHQEATDLDEASDGEGRGHTVNPPRSTTTDSSAMSRSDENTNEAEQIPQHSDPVSDVEDGDDSENSPILKKTRSRKATASKQKQTGKEKARKREGPILQGGRQYALTADQLEDEEDPPSDNSYPEIPSVFDEAKDVLNAPTQITWIDAEEEPLYSDQSIPKNSPIRRYDVRNTDLWRRIWPNGPPPEGSQVRTVHGSRVEDLYGNEKQRSSPQRSSLQRSSPQRSSLQRSTPQRGISQSLNNSQVSQRTRTGNAGEPIVISDNGTPSTASSDERPPSSPVGMGDLDGRDQGSRSIDRAGNRKPSEGMDIPDLGVPLNTSRNEFHTGSPTKARRQDSRQKEFETTRRASRKRLRVQSPADYIRFDPEVADDPHNANTARRYFEETIPQSPGPREGSSEQDSPEDGESSRNSPNIVRTRQASEEFPILDLMSRFVSR